MEATLKVTYTRRDGSRLEPELHDLVEHVKRWGGADVEIEVIESDAELVRVDSLVAGERFAMDGRVFRIVETLGGPGERTFVEALDETFGAHYAFRDPASTEHHGGFSYATKVRRMP